MSGYEEEYYTWSTNEPEIFMHKHHETPEAAIEEAEKYLATFEIDPVEAGIKVWRHLVEEV